MKYSVTEILTHTNGYLFYKSPRFDKNEQYTPCAVTSLVFQSDNVIFVPIKISINNALVDSFQNIEAVIKSGIRAFMFDEKHFNDKSSYEKLIEIINKYRNNIDFIIMVEDTVQAIFALASYTRTYKMSDKTKYLTVTGSIGKTTTTEMLYGILNKKFKIYRGEPGANIKLRVAHKFLEVEPDIDYFLFECSGQGSGYLKYFSELIMPDGAIITKIANENLGEYLTLKNIAKEKSTMLSAMSENSIAVINGDPLLRKATEDYICDKIYINDGSYKLINSDKNGSEFVYKDETYFIPVVGIHHIDNAVKVIELALKLGIETKLIKDGLSEYKAVGNRWVVDKFKDNVEFITDCPNNPSYDTLITNIHTFLDLYKDNPYKRIIITRIKALGDFEEQTYLKLAQELSSLPIQELICVGSEIISIKEYVEKHSSIKTVYFDKPMEINEHDSFVKYLLNTLNFEQAVLLKGQRKDGLIGYGKVKDVLRKYL